MSRRVGIVLLVVVAFGSSLVALAPGKMRSEKLGNKLCETNGGGKFVDIPGFPGEMIDRRLKNDVRWLVDRYDIYVTDGYSTSDVHAWNGEHPIGLALDIVPNKAKGGNWRKIDRLATWAEPKQNRPRSPFRWVGYDGDSGHGRGHHLHLSWNHSMTKPKRPAKTVYTVNCPGHSGGEPAPEKPDDPNKPKPDPDGGIDAGSGGGSDGSGGGVTAGSGGGSGSGGVGARIRGPVVSESGGVSAGG